MTRAAPTSHVFQRPFTLTRTLIYVYIIRYLPPRVPHDQMTVKDTANITRKKAQLPQQESLEHPTPVGGSWLKNRYIVNNYILLEPLGTGSYAEVFTICTYRF